MPQIIRPGKGGERKFRKWKARGWAIPKAMLDAHRNVMMGLTLEQWVSGGMEDLLDPYPILKWLKGKCNV